MLIPASIRVRREVPLPIPGDRRAWDAGITDGTVRASIEGVSRIDDMQALARQIALKTRDAPNALR